MKNYNKRRTAHWNKVANKLRTWKGWGKYYNTRVSEVYRFNIPPDQSILDIGTGTGNLLSFLDPEKGVGVDFSGKMIELAKELHPNFDFIQMDAVEFKLKENFDSVVMSDTVNDLWDVQSTLENISKVLKNDGRLIINFYNRLWELPLKIAEILHLAKPNLVQNWLTVKDAKNLLDLAGFEVIK